MRAYILKYANANILDYQKTGSTTYKVFVNIVGIIHIH